MIGYVDISYVGNLKDKKLIIKYYFFLGKVIIICYSKQQYTVLTSILEAKYMAISQKIKKKI